MKVEIFIATHKAYSFPKNEGYIPIHVGKALTELDLGIIGDNTGDNISKLNPNFCELTALYWMWKNSNSDVLGLVHYRRYFKNYKKLLAIEELSKIDENTIIVPKVSRFIKGHYKFLSFKLKRKYFTVSEHYNYCHNKSDWDCVREVISELSPDYLKSFDEISKTDLGISCYNMFVTRKSILNGYCEWLFPILFEVSNRIHVNNEDLYQKRVFGFMSERLLNIYIHKNRLKVVFKNICFIE